MDPKVNKYLVEMTKDITIAQLANTNVSNSISVEGGKAVADFMQEIYNKLVELNGNF